MDPSFVHKGVGLYLEMDKAPVQLKDGTWMHFARITNFTRLADLDKLVGLNLWGEEVTSVMPEQAHEKQFGRTIGLVMKSRKWSGK